MVTLILTKEEANTLSKIISQINSQESNTLKGNKYNARRYPKKPMSEVYEHIGRYMAPGFFKIMAENERVKERC